MDQTRPTLNQLNIVSGNVDASIAFYRRLGVEIPEPRIWRTATGAHHVSAIEGIAPDAATLDLDSAAFAQIWNKGWAGRKDLAGRVVVGFSVSSREEVDPTVEEDVRQAIFAAYPEMQSNVANGNLVLDIEVNVRLGRQLKAITIRDARSGTR